MNTAYLTVIAAAGAAAITHIGLVDDQGAELSGGDYTRQPVSWAQTDGLIRPDADLTFDVPGGMTVAGWRGYDAATGGTDYDGAALSQETYAEQGTYRLLAAQTAINHVAS